MGKYDSLMRGGAPLADPNQVTPPDESSAPPSSPGGGKYDSLMRGSPSSLPAAYNGAFGADPSAGDKAAAAFDSAGAYIGGKFKQAQGYQAGRFITAALTLGGKALQPFAAPQQFLFGTIKSIEDLATGHDPSVAYESFKTGAQAALGFLTYGGYNAGQSKTNGKDVRNNSILGYDIFKEANAPDWLAKWGGLATDLFVDVPLVGAIGKAAKLGKIGDVSAKFDNVFRNGNDLQKFAAHLVAAPFSTAPLPHLIAAIPEGNIGNLAGRAQIGRNIGNLIEQARSVPQTSRTEAVSSSRAEQFIAPSGRVQGVGPVNFDSLKTTGLRDGAGLPDQYIALEAAARQVKATIGMKLVAAGTSTTALMKGLAPAQATEYQKIIGRLIDHKGPADQTYWRGELQTFANAQPNPADFMTQADKALNHSMQADVYAAQNLHKVGLMTKAELAKYESGDQGHLRRLFSLWDNPGANLERIRTAHTPATMTFDNAQMSKFFDEAIASRAAGSPPVRVSGAQMAADARAGLAVPNDPAGSLLATMRRHGFAAPEILHVLKNLGGDYARKAGIKYVPNSDDLYKSLSAYADKSKQGFGGAGGIVGGSSIKPIAQRTELADWQLEGMGEISDHMTRVDRQGQVVGKIVSRRMVTQGYYDLMTKDNVILPTMPHGITDTSGWRSVGAEQAQALALPNLEGKMIPAIFHRRLMDSIKIPDASVASAVFDFTAAAWRRSKLASPAAMGRNLASGYIAANQYGISPKELLQGAVDYHKLVSGAARGDGVFDQAFKVNGVSMADMTNHGEFIHGSMMHQEVTGPMANFVDNVSNSVGSPFQRNVEAAAKWIQDVSAGEKGLAAKAMLGTAAVAGDFAGLGTGPITKFLSDKYGMLDAHTKGSIYMSLRKKGMSGEDAARHADEALFNYENVPYVVNTLRKFGLVGLPFASYQVLAAGRFFKNSYERPYLMQRNYRVANSASADQSQAEKANEYYASPGYIKDALWVRLGQDDQGRPKYVNLASMLPESPVWDMSNSDNVTNFEPPLLQLYRTILSGQGFQGRPTFAGGKSYSDTKNVNPQEAARGLVKAMWQFGASPWAPGQPGTERLTKSIMAAAMTQDQIASPNAQRLLKAMQEGPAAAYQPDGIGIQKKGSTAPSSILDSALRFAGVTLQTIQPDYSKAGTGQSNLRGDNSSISLLKAQFRDAMLKAITPEQRDEVKARYKGLIAVPVQERRTQTDASRAAK